MTTSDPAHPAPTSCFVCGSTSEHPDTSAQGGHRFISNADADAAAREHDRHVTFSPEAAYVDQHRPY